MYIALDYEEYNYERKEVSITVLEYDDGVAYDFKQVHIFNTVDELENYLSSTKIDHIMTDPESFNQLPEKLKELLNKEHNIKFY